MKTYLTILISLFIFLINTISAQDTIQFKDGSEIQAKILDIQDDQITYTFSGREDNLTITTKPSKIKKIKLNNGKIIAYNSSLSKDMSHYHDDHRNILKINTIGIYWGVLRLNYERGINAKESFDIGIGLSGLWRDEELIENVPNGIDFSAAYKFKLLLSKKRKFHGMTGVYFMPRVRIGRGDINLNSLTRLSGTYASGDICIGIQFIINNRFVLDYGWSAGGGYISPNFEREYYDPFLHLGDMILTDGFSLGQYITIGINFGEKFR